MPLVKEMITQLVAFLIVFYFIEHFKIITTNLSKQQELHASPKAIEQTNFTANLDPAGQGCMFENMTKHLKILFWFDIVSI